MSNFGLRSFDSGKKAREGQKLSAALSDFRQARRQAALHAVLARLQGSSLELLSYEKVSKQLHVTGQVERGLRQIPLDKIVGSVGRYHEFDRSFLPLKDYDAQRWAGVRAAADPTELPAIDVYQIDDAYFVIDGNHRVSIARRKGIAFLEANVIEIKTRVPLPSDARHDELIVAAEQAAFLEHTRLDRLRPNAELKTSLPGQYDKLENHIEVHRFFLEMGEDRELADEEAVIRWYEEAYLPVVETIREYGLLREFEGRTETDLYLWIAENQAALRNELGWEVSPKTAVENLPPHLVNDRQGTVGRLYRRVRRAVVPRKQEGAPTWSRQKTLERYSDRLFAAVLAIFDGKRGESAVAHAAAIARLEESHLLAVQVDSAQAVNWNETQQEQTRAWYDALLGEAGVSGEIWFEQGELTQLILRRANLVDLVVLDPALLVESGALLDGCTRPVLLASGTARPIRRILLLYDGRPQAHEALFAAAYMAEMWGCQVVILAEPTAAPQALSRAAPYLEMHETPPESTIAGPLTRESVFRTAAEHDCDLIVVGGYTKRPLSKAEVAAWLHDSTQDAVRPLLICP